MASHPSSSSLQRIKVGLIGLAAVILLIAVASAVMRSVTRVRPVQVAGAAKPDVVANLAVLNESGTATTDPVSDLGVAPSAGNQQAGAAR